MTMKDENGKYRAYAWPGGYPVYYTTNHEAVICSDCANSDDALDIGERITDYDINFENELLWCDACSKRIPSAYGDDGE